MPKYKRKILIPVDPSSPDMTVVHFQHNGETKFVPLGHITYVPDWVIDRNPMYAKHEIK